MNERAAVVTGASTGIGYAVVKRLARAVGKSGEVRVLRVTGPK